MAAKLPDPIYTDEHVTIRPAWDTRMANYGVVLEGKDGGMMPSYHSRHKTAKAAQLAYIGMLVDHVAHLNTFLNIKDQQVEARRLDSDRVQAELRQAIQERNEAREELRVRSSPVPAAPPNTGSGLYTTHERLDILESRLREVETWITAKEGEPSWGVPTSTNGDAVR
jgi:hypothetical protein